MLLKRLVPGLSVILFLASCQKTIKGEGPLVTRKIDIGQFTELSVNIPVRVNLVFSDSIVCAVRAQKNIADAIEYRQHSDELEFDSDYSLKSNQPIELYLSTPVIESVTVNGSGDLMFVNPAKGDELEIQVNGSGSINALAEMKKVDMKLNGSGDLSIEGSAERTSCNINGSGDLHASKFATNQMQLEINGSGNASLYVISKLKADIRGSGDVTYKGQPHVISEIIGSGTIKKSE